MKKIMFLPLSCAVLTTFAALANAQGFHETNTIVRPEPALNSLNRPAAIPDLKLDNSFRETTFRPESTVISQSTVSPPSVNSEHAVKSSSVTIQVTPPPEDNSDHTEVHHPHHTDPTPTPFTSETHTVTTQIPPPMAIRGGEKYPQTRTRPITEEEATTMNYAELRYAINEMYARHGADFPKAAITRRFLKDLAGYRPRIGVSLDDIEKEFNQFEYANEQVLAKHKADRWAGGER